MHEHTNAMLYAALGFAIVAIFLSGAQLYTKGTFLPNLWNSINQIFGWS